MRSEIYLPREYCSKCSIFSISVYLYLKFEYYKIFNHFSLFLSNSFRMNM